MYKNKKIVVFGVSQDSSKYGYKIFTTLADKKFHVYGINPKGGMLQGRCIYTSMSQISDEIDVAILVIPPEHALLAVKQCVEARVKEIWFQPGTRDMAAIAYAQERGIAVHEACFMAENGLW